MAVAAVGWILGILLVVRGRVEAGGAPIVLAVVLPIVGSILLHFLVVRAYQIPSQSMEPTLGVGDRILVNQTGIGGFSVGDIVVFHPPAGADNGVECGATVNGRQPIDVGESCPKPTGGESSQVFDKRIVAGPGDELSIRDGHPVVNGVEKTNEPYITPCGGGAACNLPKPITIPPGDYFMLGDNRGASDDSRFWGPVPERWIVGVVFVRFWPLGSVSIF